MNRPFTRRKRVGGLRVYSCQGGIVGDGTSSIRTEHELLIVSSLISSMK